MPEPEWLRVRPIPILLQEAVETVANMTFLSISPVLTLRRMLLVTGIVAAACVFFFSYESKPRVLAVGEVQVAYWAWLGNVPSPTDLSAAMTATKSRTLFLRAGQFDLEDGSIERIRAAGGILPSGVELHLVYNATQRFLRELDSLDASLLTAEVLKTFYSDAARGHRDHAQVFGLQLDFDVPNRVLPKYGVVLRDLRHKLPPKIKLSVTGLPTWTTTPDDLKFALEAVDFWVPQCYGGTVPTKLGQRIPIAAASEVARTMVSVRKVGKPFYAGLAAYGYAILYSKEGNLLELRGNIDPAMIAGNSGLELIDRRPFGDGDSEEMRYEYLATRDLVIDGLIIKPTQTVVVDQPSSASLRANARAVRENAGELLLGISVFRLPSSKDDTVLTIDEIMAALNDSETIAATELKLETKDTGRVLELSTRSTGTAASVLGDDAFTVDVDVPAGHFKRLTAISGFSTYETLCRRDRTTPPERCSPQRANVIRLRSPHWRQGDKASASLDIESGSSASITATVTTRVDDGRYITQNFELTPKENDRTKANNN